MLILNDGHWQALTQLCDLKLLSGTAIVMGNRPPSISPDGKGNVDTEKTSIFPLFKSYRSGNAKQRLAP